ncbi:MAG: tyrosine-type recombinase/integrase [Methylococcales bacterium]
MGRDGGGVKAASETSIQITFIYNGEQCRERIKLKPTPVNLDRVRQHRELILAAIENDTFDYAVTFPNSKYHKRNKDAEKPKIKLKAYLNKWLNEKQYGVKSSTFNGYIKIINRINLSIGDIALEELTTKDVSDFARTLPSGNKTIGNIISPLRKALDDAVQDMLIETNPIKNWAYKKIMPPKPRIIDPFTREEQELILSELAGQNHNLVKFALWTGLRTSELCAIEWGDIDWNKRLIRIERAKTQSTLEDETTKTVSSIRDVKLLRPALEALIAQKSFTFLQDHKIFHNPRTDLPWTGDQAIRKTCWLPAIKKAGVRYRKPYQTRHTFASMLLSAGENLAWVSRMLGHSSVTQTSKAYATWIPDSIPDAGEKAVNLFSDNKTYDFKQK